MDKIKQTTVTIGIPAFNEEANIGHLILDLFAQKQTEFQMEKIIVASDASRDSTDKIVRGFNDSRLLLLANNKRKGKATRQMQIIKSVNSDILVLLDADIRIRDRNFLNKLVKPMSQDDADLTSCPLISVPSEIFLERVLSSGFQFKDSVFEKHLDANNLYTCHGPVRAFSKKLYQSIKFKHSVSEDAYSYLFCIYHGMKYTYVRNTRAFFKLPSKYSDHEKQNFRAFEMRGQFDEEFGKEFVRKSFYLPFLLKLEELTREILRRPVDTASYIILYFFLRLKAPFRKKANSAWQMANSSKMLRGAI